MTPQDKAAPMLPIKGHVTREEPPSILIPSKCEACKDTGEVEARVQYHTKHGRTCQIEKRPCQFCENGLDMDRKRAPSPSEAGGGGK